MADQSGTSNGTAGGQGRLATSKVGELDMAKHEDRRLFLTAMCGKRWGRNRWRRADEQFADEACDALREALRLAKEREDHRAVNGIVSTLATLEGQVQADEHLAIRTIMAGKESQTNTDNHVTVVVQYAHVPTKYGEADHGTVEVG